MTIIKLNRLSQSKTQNTPPKAGPTIINNINNHYHGLNATGGTINVQQYAERDNNGQAASRKGLISNETKHVNVHRNTSNGDGQYNKANTKKNEATTQEKLKEHYDEVLSKNKEQTFKSKIKTNPRQDETTIAHTKKRLFKGLDCMERIQNDWKPVSRMEDQLDEQNKELKKLKADITSLMGTKRSLEQMTTNNKIHRDDMKKLQARFDKVNRVNMKREKDLKQGSDESFKLHSRWKDMMKIIQNQDMLPKREDSSSKYTKENLKTLYDDTIKYVKGQETKCPNKADIDHIKKMKKDLKEKYDQFLGRQQYVATFVDTLKAQENIHSDLKPTLLDTKLKKRSTVNTLHGCLPLKQKQPCEHAEYQAIELLQLANRLLQKLDEVEAKPEMKSSKQVMEELGNLKEDTIKLSGKLFLEDGQTVSVEISKQWAEIVEKRWKAVTEEQPTVQTITRPATKKSDKGFVAGIMSWWSKSS